MNTDYKTEFNPIEGWMVDSQLKFLSELASRPDIKTVLEMGCWKGRLTWQLCKTGKDIFAVDTFKGSPGEISLDMAKEQDILKIFQENTKEFKNLMTIQGDSLKAAARFDDKGLDMVFIDGTHTYDAVKADIEAWLPKTKVIIAGHDYYWPGVKEAVAEKLGDVKLFETIWWKELA
jgi:precorrin-6B methylase 2